MRKNKARPIYKKEQRDKVIRGWKELFELMFEWGARGDSTDVGGEGVERDGGFQV